MEAEKTYPQRVYVCDQCKLVQLPSTLAADEVFDKDYTYFSSYSQSWLKHCEKYVVDMVDRFGFNSNTTVMEVASNDGYLLQYFKQRSIPCLGIEPTKSTAKVSRERKIPTLDVFLGIDTAQTIRLTYGGAKLLIANNVIAHVPDLNDFVGGLGQLLAPDGILTIEFPVLHKLIENRAFDTIYHEHFSYLSFTTVLDILGWHGLTVFDVEELPTHGGSVRVFARHADNFLMHPIKESVYDMLMVEEALGHYDMSYYSSFAQQALNLKLDIQEWFAEAKDGGNKVVGFGAPGKGNTMLNYCSIRGDLMDFVVDDSPHKQGKYLPGSRIPVLSPDYIRIHKPDYVVIMPWNLKEEIAAKLDYIKEWGGQCVVFMPEVRVL